MCITDMFSTTDNVPDESPDPEAIVETIRTRLNSHNNDQEPVPLVCSMVVNDLHVCHVPEHKIFSVATHSGSAHSVRLFPKETCTCPSTSTCCHIIAAKRSIGIETQQRRPICLTQLRRNSRF
jgi:hypothetical protein